MTPRIDAHQHFWRFRSSEFRWIDPASALASDHLPADLKPLLDRHAIGGTIAVQARQTEEETQWLASLAATHDWLLGVVGWVDLRADDVCARIETLRRLPGIVGFRHVVQDEPDDDFLLTPAFVRGVRAVLNSGLAYDILVNARQAQHVRRFVDQVGDGRLVLDHGAKPDIAAGAWQPWAEAIADMAASPTLSCKISGLVTEADHRTWKPDDIRRYLDHLLASFGPERLIFGSDWPVCRLAADYGRVVDLIDEFIERACPDDRAAIFGGNAVRLYALDHETA